MSDDYCPEIKFSLKTCFVLQEHTTPSMNKHWGYTCPTAHSAGMWSSLESPWALLEVSAQCPGRCLSVVITKYTSIYLLPRHVSTSTVRWQCKGRRQKTVTLRSIQPNKDIRGPSIENICLKQEKIKDERNSGDSTNYPTVVFSSCKWENRNGWNQRKAKELPTNPATLP